MQKLSSEAITMLMLKVLYNSEELKEEIPKGVVLVKGIVHDYGFHPERVKLHKPDIDALLSELPDQFFRNRGGGWSFLNACVDRHGEQWGEQRDAESLICLGIAIGSASWLLEDMADILPGGVPYLEVHPYSELNPI
jgi:hypothetical protein